MGNTNLRKATSRRNGAKSRGPVTPQDKIRSATNAVCLATEDKAAFEAVCGIYIERLQPADDFEQHLVLQLAGLDWRLQRAGAIETALLDLEIDILAPEIQKTTESIDAEGLWAIGFKSLSDHSNSLFTLDRHQTRLVMQYDRIRRHLADFQRDRAPEIFTEPEHAQLPSNQHAPEEPCQAA